MKEFLIFLTLSIFLVSISGVPQSFAQNENPSPYFEVISITELQNPGTYLYSFEACTGAKEIRLGDIFFVSDVDTVMVPPKIHDIIVEPFTCGTWEIQIRADDPAQIKLMIPSPIEDNVMIQAEMLGDEQTPKFQMTLGLTESGDSSPHFTVLSTTETEIPGTYLYSFEACTADREIRLGDVFFSSGVDLVKVPPEDQDTIVDPFTCGTYAIQIRADDPEQIRLMVPSPIEENMMIQAEILSAQQIPPKFQVKQGILAENVACKEGLVLMIKNSDGSPACVNSSTSSKLEIRGWGVVS